MTDDDFRADFLRSLDRIEEKLAGYDERLGALQGRVSQIESDERVANVIRENVEKRLTSIETQITRLVWLVLGTLITGLVGLMITGGVHVPIP